MTAPTDDDFEAQRARIDKLRQQGASAETLRIEREKDASRQIEKNRLDAEEARLKAELAVTQNAGKVGVIKAGTETVTAPQKEQLHAAQGSVKAATAATGKAE
jgi:hypothetical protein